MHAALIYDLVTIKFRPLFLSRSHEHYRRKLGEIWTRGSSRWRGFCKARSSDFVLPNSNSIVGSSSTRKVSSTEETLEPRFQNTMVLRGFRCGLLFGHRATLYKYETSK